MQVIGRHWCAVGPRLESQQDSIDQWVSLPKDLKLPDQGFLPLKQSRSVALRKIESVIGLCVKNPQDVDWRW